MHISAEQLIRTGRRLQGGKGGRWLLKSSAQGKQKAALRLLFAHIDTCQSKPNRDISRLHSTAAKSILIRITVLLETSIVPSSVY